MSDATFYVLLDGDHEWWESDGGELFTLLNNSGTRSTLTRYRNIPLDRIMDLYGVIDDGVTEPDPSVAAVEELRTLLNAEPVRVVSYITKDSGERAQFDSGMQRDTEKGKPRFDLFIPEGVPYEEQFLTRIAALLARGAEKYEDRNWEQANSQAEVNRMKSSAFRHFMEWFCGNRDEDHAAAAVFNLLAAETTEYKINTNNNINAG